MMKSRFLFYFVPFFLTMYVIVGLFARVGTFNKSNELFPFFCFDLYANVPNTIIAYDIRFNSNLADEHNLFFKNRNLNKIEKKYYRTKLYKVASEYENTGFYDTSLLEDLNISDVTSVHLVKYIGTYSAMIREGKYDVIVLKKIK